MSFDVDTLGAASAVNVDVYTRDFRISGSVQTRFTRVAEILNQLANAYLSVDHATISEHADPSATRGAPQAWVAVDQILLMIAPDLGGEARADMRIPKRPVLAQLLLPPLRVTGRIHVPMPARRREPQPWRGYRSRRASYRHASARSAGSASRSRIDDALIA